MSLSKDQTAFNNQLTRFPSASLRELVTLAIPLIFSYLSASLLGLCDRLFLSHYSLEAWNAASAGGSVAFIFQMLCMMIVMVSQVYIGQHIGAKSPEKVGPIVWQMIWFSFLSMLVTYPISLLAEHYFYGTEIETSAIIYFRCLAAGNFLYPLGLALVSFFLGRGKTRIIFFTTLLAQGLNVLLDYLLIFGIQPILPPLGVFGAALATVISQGVSCSFLFFVFAKSKYIPRFRTDDYGLKPKLLWELLQIGLPRAFGRAMVIGSWIFASYLLIEKGGDFLIVHTLGTSLFLIFTFMNDGLGQALLTISSHLLGAQLNEKINLMLKSSCIFQLIILTVVAVPLLMMQESIIFLFVKASLSEGTLILLKKTCYWIWFAILANGINRIGVSLITASKDTLFYACSVTPLWITLCVPVYLGIGWGGWGPDKFFLIDSTNTLIIGMIYITRFKRRYAKGLQEIHATSL